MQLRNNYMMEWKRDGETEKGKGVFNGDMGRIEGINRNPDGFRSLR